MRHRLLRLPLPKRLLRGRRTMKHQVQMLKKKSPVASLESKVRARHSYVGLAFQILKFFLESPYLSLDFSDKPF